jgi:hypothetical protein
MCRITGVITLPPDARELKRAQQHALHCAMPGAGEDPRDWIG